MALDFEPLLLFLTTTSWSLVLVLGGIGLLVRSLYRLYFHPLSHIPGPRLAAITHAVEFYYDVICNGRYIWEIEKMHRKYGPVVRINPREVHIKDPHFYDDVYAPTSKKREKDSHFVGLFGLPTSMVATTSHELHRFRRGLLNNFFSKRSVLALSSIIQEKQSKLMQRLETTYHDDNDAIFQLDNVYAALTADIISDYAWGESAGYLDNANFNNDIREALNQISEFSHINRFFPILSTIMRAMPRRVLGWIRPGATAVLDMQDTIMRSSVRNSRNSKKKTIFDALMNPTIPFEERRPRRIQDEGLVLLIAGTETTARVLTLGSHYIFRDCQLLLRLRNELRAVMPTPTSKPSWSDLEKLPYLSGVVNEAIRLSHGPTFRSTRVAPTESLIHKDILIPPRVPVSMISYFVHMDPSIFPEPECFKPERWVEAAEQGQHLNKFIVSFSRGSRSCLGINLAYAEIYMAFAAMIRRFDLEFCEMVSDNLRIDRDMGIGQPKEGTNFSVHVRITKVIAD